MRFVVIITFLLFVAARFHAQSNDVRVPAASQELPAVEFEQLNGAEYANQREVWQQQVVFNPKNENAWLNFYKAERYSNYSNHSRNISNSSQFRQNDILSNMQQHVPNSFAYHYSFYLNNDKSVEAFDHLVKAYQIDPNAAELYDDMLAKAVIEKDDKQKNIFAKKLFESGVYTPAVMEYARNVYASMPANSIIATYGNADTYPLMLLQEISGLRKDVIVLCLDWLGSEKYRAEIAGVMEIPSSKINSESSRVLEQIVNANSGKTVYLSLTIPPGELKKYQDRCYLTGLAMLVSNTQKNNIPSLANNWEIHFSKIHITDQEEINKNYFLPLLELAIYYKDTNQFEKQKQVEETLHKLPGNLASSDAVKKYLD